MLWYGEDLRLQYCFAACQHEGGLQVHDERAYCFSIGIKGEQPWDWAKVNGITLTQIIDFMLDPFLVPARMPELIDQPEQQNIQESEKSQAPVFHTQLAHPLVHKQEAGAFLQDHYSAQREL
jgi:hypothetical protein